MTGTRTTPQRHRVGKDGRCKPCTQKDALRDSSASGTMKAPRGTARTVTPLTLSAPPYGALSLRGRRPAAASLRAALTRSPYLLREGVVYHLVHLRGESGGVDRRWRRGGAVFVASVVEGGGGGFGGAACFLGCRGVAPSPAGIPKLAGEGKSKPAASSSWSSPAWASSSLALA